MADDVTFPLADGTGLDDPFPFFARCRRESPVLFYAPWNAWFVFKHDDIAALGREPRLSMKRMDLFKMNAPEHLRDRMDFLESDLGTMVVMLDGVDHHRVRAALQQYFTPHMIAAMAPAIARHVETLLDRLEGRASCDIATEVCRKLPLLVLADLFALPQEDFSRLEKWGYDFIEYFNRVPVPESYTLALIDTARDMMAYTRALIAERRSNPGDDLISTLVRGQGQPGGLSDEEIVANVMMVLIAGNDTVGSALGNAVYLLLSHPAELAKVQSGQATWAGVLEEILPKATPSRPGRSASLSSPPVPATKRRSTIRRRSTSPAPVRAI